MAGDFTSEQKRYLEGLASGLQVARIARGNLAAAPSGPHEHEGPDASHLAAQDRVLARHEKLSDQEKVKREEHPFDAYGRLKEQAARNEFPKAPDNFRWRYYGLFYVAPAENSYMCRLRIPNGILTHWQFAGIADLAERHGGGYAHVTTRANLQIREIEAKNAPAMVEAIQDLGLSSRGSGADNIRNVTGTPTAGIDPRELIDTRPYAREWHFHILNDRSLYGLPRKFNVAFDGGGMIPVLEDTNDIGFQAVQVKEGFGVAAGAFSAKVAAGSAQENAPNQESRARIRVHEIGSRSGVWFRLMIGGITGHKDFARDTGVIVKPDEATKVADAIVRVFIEHGDRTNRNKARLKYVLDEWGFDKFLAAVEEKLGKKLVNVPAGAIAPRPAFDRTAHVGVHPQKQDGLYWIGVVLPVGKLTAAQIRGLASIAQTCGDGDIRLTVWQNLILSGVPAARVEEAEARIAALGLATSATSIRAGLIACTGNRGCRFSASDTKTHAEAIAQWCEERVAIDVPVNIHLTGCHHSCAQHYIGDIGLIACKVLASEDADPVEGYHVHVGGGFGPDAALARELYRDVTAADVPRIVERILKAYVAHRVSPHEPFVAFTRRHDSEILKRLCDMEAAE